MKFESISIKNFRIFENIEIGISNKNIFFGLNDIGKTNFLYALRYMFDKDIRKNGFIDSDFHKKKTSEPIEITVVIDMSDTSDADTQKLRAQLKGALRSEHKKAYIRLTAKYTTQELNAMPEMFWGGDKENLCEIKQRGYRYDIDYVFNVIYIDSYVDMQNLFKKNVKLLLKSENSKDNDTFDKIQRAVDKLNTNIASLSGVKQFEKKITPEYQKFRSEKVSISVKSEIAVKGLYSNIVPYIKQDDDENLYPTSGEGRKKLLSYSIYDLLSEENREQKINIFLVEEPENHLHKSLQIALSQILFADKKYQYLFVTTHSPFVLYNMDKVRLIRIFHGSSIYSASYFYKVPSTFEKNRKMLNRYISEAVFANKVLLVEGASELLLFERVLSAIDKFYEVNGAYILSVEGVGFRNYREMLNALQIRCFVKTDNDFRRNGGNKEEKNDYSTFGFQRCNKIIGEKILPIESYQDDDTQSKKAAYEKNQAVLDSIRENYGIYLSKVDLENDLDEVLHDKLCGYLKTNSPVEYLQKSKQYNMVKLIGKISDKDCQAIFDHYNFACLKELLK